MHRHQLHMLAFGGGLRRGKQSAKAIIEQRQIQRTVMVQCVEQTEVSLHIGNVAGGAQALRPTQCAPDAFDPASRALQAACRIGFRKNLT